MKQKLFSHVTSRMGCPSNSSHFGNFCNTVQVQILCPGTFDDIHTYRKRRSAHKDSDDQKLPVVISIHMNFSSTVPDVLIVHRVKSAGLQLLHLLNTSFSIVLDSGQAMSSLEGAKFEGESFICESGFSFVKDMCVLSEIESSLSFKPNVQLTPVQITTSSVILEWPQLGDDFKKLITGILIEHRKVGDVQWFLSSMLDSTVTSFTLTSLASDSEFSAQLVAFTTWPGKRRWKIGETYFKTTPASAQASPKVSLTDVAVGETTAAFFWDHLAVQYQPISVTILYKQSHQDSYQTMTHELTASKTHAELQNLDPHTTYTAQLVLLLSSDTEMRFHPVHFVTLDSRGSSAELLVGIVTACAVTAVTSVILTLFCIIWWQRRSRGKNTGFENKTFGIQLENNNMEASTGPGSNPAVN
ncbi:unnamed protein product [Candidula unifasciata]|uniref:Fibronectin type-III domain-containing protein n=1 Tax=Candidula unifasciata TaxID=100452 RepID=A0A8S4A1V6_9EUPU|nr:unnamed protein product [Candidula unifasciata]